MPSVVAIGAHPDDVELMALPEIAAALDRRATVEAVVCCDGGVPEGPDDVAERRRSEARAAARIGGFGLTLLECSSADVRGARFHRLADALTGLLSRHEPDLVVTHAPTDRHPTHVAVCAAAVAALKALPSEGRPARLLGCEVWGGLDWLGPDAVRRDVGALADLSDRLLGAHRSQLDLRSYDAAARGRALANAVFADPHHEDVRTGELLALDLTPAIEEGGPSLRVLAAEAIARHGERVDAALEPYSDDG